MARGCVGEGQGSVSREVGRKGRCQIAKGLWGALKGFYAEERLDQVCI